MDSQVSVEGRLLEIVYPDWRLDKLPSEDIAVPVLEISDPEPDASTPHQTLRQQEYRWTDLMLANLADASQANNTNN